ncbi:RES domain-containing protein [Massilia violaceinigra]|uniref:RES domain-containing protein n=1 Tax=Massilia violaceinigra TaxID=2045208 RepID=A0ABY4ADJ6_9BURK|nr:RES domain-containing protein [Massilia violaceinigra]
MSVINLDVGRLLRLSRFPRTEPYWGKRKAYRFDDPAQLYGASYAAQELKVAFAETVLHQKGDFIGGQWVIAEANKPADEHRPGSRTFRKIQGRATAHGHPAG